MKKKIFLMLCVSMLASSMYAGVRLKPKTVQVRDDVPEFPSFTDPVMETSIEEEETPL